MKKLFLPILFATLSSNFAFAQVTLTTTTSTPLPGDTYVEYGSSSNIIGASGANITWDYSNLDQSLVTDTLQYLGCAPDLGCDTFQNVGLVMQQPRMDNNVFYSVNGSAFTYSGQGFQTAIKYSNGKDLLRFPFTYGSSYIDTFAANTINVAPDNQFTHYYYGTETVTCDGYGTLILPNGTTDNVLRIHRIEVTTDSAVYEAVGTTIKTILHSYMWFSTTQRIELMDLYTSVVDGDSTRPMYNVFYNKQIPTTTAVKNVNKANALSIYPNPTNGIVNIQYSNANGNSIRISIADVTGREVSVIDGTNSGQVQYNTSNLQPGLYFVRLQSDNGIITRKLEVL